MSRLPAYALAATLAAALLAGCDGEPVDYSGERYDIFLTWVDGNVELDRPAVFGSLGVAAATNQPGSRHGAMRWKSADGDFWLFGGEGFDAGTAPGRLHDLWKYNVASGLWTWVGGETVVGGTLSHSGAGVYGTQGVAAAGNLPGARNDAVTWTDTAGNLWLFGGHGHDSAGTLGRLNDLWQYNVASGLWTWVGGSNLVNQSGVYGTVGVADAANVPGARHSATGWIDGTGALWLFGGSGLDAVGGCCFLNDLWKYSAGTWTWVNGSDSKDPLAVYGTQGTAAAANTPSGRFNGMSWYDPTGTAWIYGGVGNNDLGARFVSAELWKFTAATGWAWVSGTKNAFVSPVHDSRGAASLTALPGSRARATTWTGSDGSLWLFGGDVETGGGFVTNPNDVWKFKTVAWTWVGGKSFDNPGATYVAPGEHGQPGGRGGASGWLGSDGKLWLFGGDADGFDRNDLWYYAP